MALSFSEKVSTRIGNRKYKVYEVTHDGSATTVDASDVGLNYIDYALSRPWTPLSDVTDWPDMSVSAGIFVAFKDAASADAIDILEFWGY